MAASTPFARGREADVYALDGDQVLRRYREGAEVTVEAAFMAHLYAVAPLPGTGEQAPILHLDLHPENVIPVNRSPRKPGTCFAPTCGRSVTIPSRLSTRRWRYATPTPP
ncbi:hypothetical protein [Verrucosispora sp. FIM060022]|uniref:hypothetical protein n=1 Tax=Verrucosispora sp. FIM060022 TaxID=1479020 RepID=UPI0018F33EC6|nr:hypothetical protein [Verrucosispora sp. FIM060022]